MTLNLFLPPSTEARLRDRAAVTGKDLATLVSEAIEEKLASDAAGAGVVQTASDFDRVLEDFFAANPETVPCLPPDFSRADLYTDHD